MRKSTKGYLFEKDNRGNCILTYQADLSTCQLTRIIGKRTVKGRKTEFEEIEVKDFQNNKYRCLIKRQDLKKNGICELIIFHSNGDRSVQRHPYTEDILDPTIIEDFGIEVLTAKHYYYGDKALLDIYVPVLKERITPELIDELNEQSKKAIASKEYHEKSMREQKSRPGLVWNKIGA